MNVKQKNCSTQRSKRYKWIFKYLQYNLENVNVISNLIMEDIKYMEEIEEIENIKSILIEDTCYIMVLCKRQFEIKANITSRLLTGNYESDYHFVKLTIHHNLTASLVPPINNHCIDILYNLQTICYEKTLKNSRLRSKLRRRYNKWRIDLQRYKKNLENMKY